MLLVGKEQYMDLKGVNMLTKKISLSLSCRMKEDKPFIYNHDAQTGLQYELLEIINLDPDIIFYPAKEYEAEVLAELTIEKKTRNYPGSRSIDILEVNFEEVNNEC